MNDRLRDFLEVTGKAFRETFAKLPKVYIAFICILVRAFFDNYRFIGMLGGTMVGGLITYFIEAIIICFVAQSLRSVVVYGNPGKKSIGNSIGNFLQPILSTLFYVYLVQMIIRLFANFLSTSFYLLLLVVFQFLVSAVLEEVYINERTGMDAVLLSGKFICDNILNYGLISLIFILIEVYINYSLTFGLGFGTQRVLYVILLAIIQTFFYMIRGHLFKELNNHSYRQRKFMRGY